MADVRIRIEVNPDASNEKIGSIAVDDVTKVQNTSFQVDSNGVYDLDYDNNFNGTEALSFAKPLVFNSSGFLSNEDTQFGVLQSEEDPRQFVWGVTDSEGNYDVTLTITKSDVSNDIDRIVLIGDPVANQFPTEAYLDGSSKPIYSDDFKWDIVFPQASASHTIRFTKWNRPNYNAVLNTIRIMLQYIDFGKTKVESFKSLSDTVPNSQNISYGVIANSGSMSILDNNGEISDWVNDNVLPKSNLKLQIYVNDNLIQTHITESSSYMKTRKEFTASLTNNLSQWRDLNYAGYPYPEHSETAYNMLASVLPTGGYTPEQIETMLKPVKGYLEAINIEYPYLKPDTFLNTVNKFCTLAQMNVYATSDNMPLFVSSRPVCNDEELTNAIRITKDCMMDELEYDLFLNNKYNAVEINENKMEKVIDYRVTLKNDPHNLLNEDSPLVNDDYPYITNEELTSGALSYDTFVENLANNGTMATYCNEKKYYNTYTINVNKYSNFNLNKCLRILKDIDYSVERFKIYQSCRLSLNLDTMQVESIERGKGPSGDTPIIEVSEESGPIKTGTKIYISSGSPVTKMIESEIPENDESGVILSEVIDNGDYYTVTYKVLVSFERIYASYSNFTNSGNVWMTGICEKFTPKFVDVEILGENENIETKEVSASDSNVNTSDTFASIQNNELIQSGTTYNSSKISDVIKTNIKTDYFNGINTGTIQIVCQDMYYKDGTLAKDFSKGEILNPDDVIFFTGDLIDGNQRYWRITSRELDYDSAPILKLGVQQVIYENKSLNDYSWEEIAQISKSGKASRMFKVGDTKKDDDATYIIMGFNHDELSDGSGYAGITFGIDKVIYSTQMNNSLTDGIGWKNSEIRSLLPYNTLPHGANYAKSVKKNSIGENDVIDTTDDKIWLFSEVEITGTESGNYAKEGKQYDYWKNIKDGTIASNRIKYNSSGNATGWWLRTAVSTSSGNSLYSIISSSGGLSFSGSTSDYGISIGFCI